jgi:hypothetical protein
MAKTRDSWRFAVALVNRQGQRALPAKDPGFEDA